MSDLFDFLMRNKILVIIVGVILLFALKSKAPEPEPVKEVKEAAAKKPRPIPTAVKKTVPGKWEKPDYSHLTFAPVHYNDHGKPALGISVSYKDNTQLAVRANCTNCVGSTTFRPAGYVDHMQFEVKQREPGKDIYYRTLGRFNILGMERKMDGDHRVVIYVQALRSEISIGAYYFLNNEKVYLELEQAG